MMTSAAAHAQVPATPPPPQPEPPARPTFVVTVIGTTQLPGVEVPIDEIPAAVKVATDRDIQESGALDIADFLNRRLNGVHVNDVQNNPFQPDVSYRGYTASPLLGTPQGVSVYMDGVRLNQPFGEVVSWDLIPRLAIATATLMPGSNPLFGLNTLGGALALQTKDGRSARGTTIQATYGSDARRAVDFEHGGQTSSSTLHWYLAGSLFAEDGWRDASPSDVRQIFGKAGWVRTNHELTATVSHANNSLTGNGLQDQQLLDRDYASVYTKPDTTDNRSTLLILSSRHRLNTKASLQAHGYYRDIRTTTLNGDINEDVLDRSIYQPDAAERAALAAAGFGSVPASGLNAGNTPFPSLRCIANVLLQAKPAETCNGLINRTRTRQHNGGASMQISRVDAFRSRQNRFIAGAIVDHSAVGFVQSTELGYLNPDRSVTGLGVFGDGGATGGTVDGEPFDTRVDLQGTVTTWSLFATDTVGIGGRGHLTLSGRYDRTSIDNRDRINPGGGLGSLDGTHVFGRFNPAAGMTFSLPHSINIYGAYSEGSRAPTSIELGCADPEEPCKLPNAMAGDPPLDQVVTHTWEAGLRQTHGRLSWNADVFRAENRHDILFVTSEQTGFGYFRNFGATRRRGVELGAEMRLGRATVGAGYTFQRATFESAETVNGEANSTNDAASAGVPGVEGSIEIVPGDRIPLIPQHLFKVYGDMLVSARMAVDLDLVATGGSFARGNENNAHVPDGTYYLGPGNTDAYAVVNLGGRYRLTRWLQIIGQVNSLFDRRYATAAQLGPAGFTAAGTFVARPFPAIAGEFPVRQTTFLAPGAPRRAWLGVRVRF